MATIAKAGSNLRVITAALAANGLLETMVIQAIKWVVTSGTGSLLECKLVLNGQTGATLDFAAKPASTVPYSETHEFTHPIRVSSLYASTLDAGSVILILA